MIATFVRNTCSIGYYRLWTAEASGRNPHVLAMIIISYNSIRKGPSEALLSRGEDVDEENVLGVAAGSQRDAGDGAGKNHRAETVALGARIASAAKGAGRLGRRGPKSIRRQHYLQGFSGPAVGQGVRPLRHGARRHRRCDLHQSGLPAGPLPDHRRRRTSVPDVGR